MRSTACFVLCICVLLGSCVPPRGATSQAAPAQSPWLDPSAQLQRRVRLVTASGIDLRQAMYVREGAGNELRIFVRTRSYAARSEGGCDPQYIGLINPATGETVHPVLDPALVPVECVSSADERRYCLAALNVGKDQPPAQAPLVLRSYSTTADPVDAQPADKLLPLGFAETDQLFCRRATSVELDGGLPAFGLDWAASGTLVSTHDGKTSAALVPYFAVDGTARAGYTVRADPALPASATIEYEARLLSGGNRGRQQWSLPYHVSYAPFAWLPPLVWADEDSLVTVAFRPDALGPSERAHYQGLFRLVALHLQNGAETLIEDRLPPYLPIVAADGVVFYTTKYTDGGKEQWELWAASLDGLAKQRLLAVDDALYLSVEDASGGRRLLVHRQYLKLANRGAELHSELTELSLDPLEGQDVAEPAARASESGADVGPAEGVPAAPSEGAGPDLPSSPSEGSGPPPIAMP